jgi:hypothetical protein
MRWLVSENSFLAVVFSTFASAFTFLFQWLLDRGRLDMIYTVPSIFADLALYLLFFLGFMTFVSFVWFIVVVFKKRKQDISEITKLTTTMEELIKELKTSPPKSSDADSDKPR